jgi:hypothetical protein
MDLTVVKGGKFTFTIGTKHLAQGLRPTVSKARNSDFLVENKGAVGIDGVLQSLEAVARLSTAMITDGFPFPQIFVFTNVIIVCGLKKIYEWNGATLDLKYTASVAGGTWSAVDFYDYVYMSNGNISVVRDAGSYVYALSTQPHATAMCNYNGQIIIGAPDVDGLGVSMVLPASPIALAVEQMGTVAVS